MQKCGNCEKPIGNLEESYEFKGHQICKECQKKLITDESVPTKTEEVIEPVKIKVIESGKQPVGWGWVFSWLFGILFLLIGIVGGLATSLLGGLCWIAISFMLLPPIRKFVYSKTNKKISTLLRAVLIFILFICFGHFADKKEIEQIEVKQTVKVNQSTKREKALTRTPKTVSLRNEHVSMSYKIQVSAKPISNDEVKFNVQTNIPLPVKVAVSIGLKDQKPNDIYIGSWGEHVDLNKPNQTFVIDIKDSDLPSGIYIAEVTFYPRWGAKNGNPRAKNIKTIINGTSEMILQGTGETIKSVQQKDKKQTWVMSNVIMGTPWDKNKFIDKLGNYEELKVTKWDPNIIKAYYFPKADMTFVVNVYSDTIETWRMGKQPE